MGPRSAPGRGGRPAAKPAIPAGLLLLGMVEEPAAPALVAEAADADSGEPKARGRRKSAPKADAGEKPARPKRAPRKKVVKTEATE
jgi:hypothetical protein